MTNPDIEKLREEIAALLFDEFAGTGDLSDGAFYSYYELPDKREWQSRADAILSLPAIRDRLRLQPIAPMPVFKSSESN